MLPDVAIQKGFENIDKVGIRELWIPMKWFGEVLQTKHSAYVSLEDERGAHMSRIVSVLLECMNREVNSNSQMYKELLEQIRKSHNSRDAHWKIRWYLRAPDLWWNFELEGSKMDDKQRWFLQLEFPYVTVCPCSAEMIRETNTIGWPHMQRCIARIKYEITRNDQWNFSRVMQLLVGEFMKVHTKAYMKREDELNWCTNITQQEWFVEDAARILANLLEEEGYKPYVVVTEHFETIHNHNVVAIKRGGLL